MPDLTADWLDAAERASAHGRVLVLGATDMGKSTFVRAVLALAGERMRVIDLDPGQKMIGPPGTVAIGALDRVDRFVFIGSTSSASIGAVARAAAGLASGAGPFIANTSGFVRGLGARLQAATAVALAPDLIVEIGTDLDAAPILAPPAGISTIRLARSIAATRKSPSARARLRQGAFDEALRGAQLIRVAATPLPGSPAPFAGPARPVCSLADPEGEDVAYGIFQGIGHGAFEVLTAGPAGNAQIVRLGRMWAEPKEGGWRLLEKLEPAWMAEAAA